MQQTRCINCMKEIDQNVRTCPHCGYDQQAEQLSYALRPNTILHGRYLVGRVIGKGGFGITYVGFDLMLEVKVAIKEYYPSGVASRNHSWSNQVVWESQSDGYQSQEQNYGSGRNQDYGAAQNQGYGSGQNQGYGSGQNQNYGSGNQGYGSSQDAQARRQESMERVLKEARRTAKLSGVPTVVRVNEVFQENETAYIIMDFIEGITLKDYLIQNGAMSWEDCRKLLFPVMDALAQAHDLGIVHRDISPDNIMIEPDGTVRLLDLGAAVDVNANNGHASMMVVKSNFSAMEQYDENGKIGSWTDVYAFAATLYYCLTGKPMTPVLDRIRNPEIAFPSGERIPEQVKDAMRRALAIYEDERTQDMREFQRELLRGDNAPKPGAWSQQNGPVWENGQDGPVINTQNSGNHDSARTSGQNGAGSEAQKTAEEEKAADTLSPSMRTTKKSRSPSKKAGMILGMILVVVVVGLVILGIPLFTSREMMSDSKFSNSYVLGSSWLREEITSITFLSTLEDEPDDSWNVSKSKLGRVKAWVEEENGECRLYIAADGGPVVAPEDCRYLFSGYTNCTEINLSEFDTSQVTDMSGMFLNCESLAELDVSGFATTQVTNMTNMFLGCSGVTELDVSGFATTQVTRMGSMFQSCSSLAELDVSGFDTSQVTDMGCMFAYCSSLTELDVSGFDTSQVTDMDYMFKNCSSLTSLALWPDCSESLLGEIFRQTGSDDLIIRIGFSENSVRRAKAQA